MKKAILVGALGVFALTSCKKDYTCECTSAISGVTTQTVSTTITDTKKNAEDACVAGSSSATVAGITSSVSCVLKD